MLENLQELYLLFAIKILNNTVYAWIKAIVIFFLALLILRLCQTILIARLKKYFAKTKTQIDDLIINAIDAVYWPFYVLAALYFAIQFIVVRPLVEKVTFYIFLVVVIYYAIRFLVELIDYGAKIIIAKDGYEQNASVVKILSTVAKIVLWLVAIVLILSNMGINVTSLIAGLGIGGVAVALALQNILGDLFNSLAIYFDKPFKIGDFVIVDNYMGTIKKIGIKTTRIEALRGEEIVMSNSDLTSARVQNFGKMEKRRAVFKIGVTYNTAAEKLEKIPDIVKQAIEKQTKVKFDRCFFNEFADSSLVYEVVYYVDSPDMAEYLVIQQAVNLELVRAFEREKIEFAFPSQTVYVKH